MSDAEGIAMNAARMSSYVKMTVIVDGSPVYIGSEFSDEPFPDETFDEISSRIADANIVHLATQVEATRNTIPTIKRSMK